VQPNRREPVDVERRRLVAEYGAQRIISIVGTFGRPRGCNWQFADS
jgi:hypothetical protein